MVSGAHYLPFPERGRLLLGGPDAKRFLHGMVTNDIAGLSPGQGCHAAMLTVKGKMLGDLAVYDRDGQQGEELLLSMEMAAFDKVRTALDRHLIMDDVTIADATADVGELGVFGAGAAAALLEALGTEADLGLRPYHHIAVTPSWQEGQGDTVRVASAPELGLPGYHVLGPRALVDQVQALLDRRGVPVLPPEQAEVLRVEAGTPRYGLDMDEERLPIEANLEDAVSFTKGCYLGQEVIARVTARGHVNRKLMGLRFPDAPEDLSPPQRGSVLSHESRPSAGTVMTAVRSPRLGLIALGYVHRSVWEPGTPLHLSTGPSGEPLAPPGLVALVTVLPFAAD